MIPSVGNLAIWHRPTPPLWAARWTYAVVAAALICLGIPSGLTPRANAVGICQAPAMSIVAHEDDDLIFQSPDLLRDIQSGRCVRTVFVTAGDAGLGQAYWAGRELGSQAAYAQMAGVSNAWTASEVSFSGRSVRILTLTQDARISLVFLRLPDGSPAGLGFPATGGQSLRKLWDGTIPAISPVDGSPPFTASSLTGTLTELMADFHPTTLRTSDWAGAFSDGDHSDHHATAYFVQTAHRSFDYAHTLSSYEGYPTSSSPQNVSGPDLMAKREAFAAYADFDGQVCSDGCPGTGEDAWIQRQYVVASESVGNVAREAGVSVAASSEDLLAGQGAKNAVDGFQTGSPIDASKEWATAGGTAGNWIEVAFVSAETVDGVMLFDRPNLEDQITGGTLKFSDGSEVGVPALNNNGSGVRISFPPRTTSSVRLTITSVSPSTASVGLAEFEIYSNMSIPNRVPTAVAGSDRPVVSGASVELAGGGSSDPDGDELAFAWTQTGGPAVVLSGAASEVASFTAPDGAAVLTFSLVVNDGTVDSAPDTVTINAMGAGVSNVARTASPAVAASSENIGGGQGVSKAVDGSLLGYPTDPSKEWATAGGTAGSWIQLAWPSPVTVDRVVLYDRPNASDQITAGTLVFSDGTSVPVGSLDDSGDATTVTFAPRTVTTLRFEIDSVSNATANVGLAEIEVWGTIPNRVPTAVSGSDRSVVSGASVELAGGGSSDPDGDELAFAWTQTGGPAVVLSGAASEVASFTAPDGAAVLTFSLVVNDGTVDSAPDTVTINAMGAGVSNVARTASPAVAASSENIGGGQGVSKAVDGSLLGYPTDPSKEWATAGGTAGSWIQLAWPSPVTVDRVVLYDRPNASDQITAGTLVFSDGTSVPVGSLDDSGDATTVTFAPRTVTTLRFEIDSVSNATANVGLAEIEVWGTIPNRVPTAVSGSDRSVVSGASVELAGGGSSDPDGDELAFAWTQTGGPAVVLSGAASEVASFTAPDGAAVLTFSLVVNDGTVDSAPDTVTINAMGAANRVPTAVAGSDRSVVSGASVELAGGGSSDPDGDELAFAWTQTGGPAVVLSGAASEVASFTAPDGAAVLTFSLVVNDGTVDSAPDTVTINAMGAANRVPTAVAGSDRSVVSGASVELAGGGSSDPDGDELAFAWTQTGGPAVVLSGAASEVASFTAPDGAAVLTFSLVVNDGTVDSAPDTVTINAMGAANRVPTAVAGSDRSVVSGASVELAGGGSSDPDGDELAFAWTQTGGPAVVLSGAASEVASFTAPDGAAVLTFSLVVNDGTVDSAPDTVTINAMGAGAAVTSPTPDSPTPSSAIVEPSVPKPVSPSVVVKVRSIGRGDKLYVNVNPNKGSGHWTFKVERRSHAGSWKTLPKVYRTHGRGETRTLHLKKGIYRVVVRAKYGYARTLSVSLRLRR